MVDSKSYFTVVKTHRDATSEVTDLSPRLSWFDKVRRGTPELDPPPLLARAPRDVIAACDQVPHSDVNAG